MPVIDKVKALPLQTLVDLAMQEAGSTEALFEVALLNNMSITDELVVGSDYIKPAVRDISVRKVFTGRLKPASAVDTSTGGYARPGGIDYMQIESDFKVR